MLDKVREISLRHLGRGAVDALVLGGDRRMAEQVLEDPRLAHLRDLPQRTLWDLPDPRLVVLQEAARRSRCVRLEISD